jgi:hypothetical protein
MSPGSNIAAMDEDQSPGPSPRSHVLPNPMSKDADPQQQGQVVRGRPESLRETGSTEYHNLLVTSSADQNNSPNESGHSSSTQQRLPPITALVNPSPRHLVPIAPRPALSQDCLLKLAGLPNEYTGPRVALYKILEEKYIMEKPLNETLVAYDRETIGGRRLGYKLDVIQEPKKARACGNGPRCECSISLRLLTC